MNVNFTASPIKRALKTMTCVVCTCLPINMGLASALEYYTEDPQDTFWMVSGSVFGCRFEQPIPGYGRAVFTHRAGEKVAFQLEANRNLMDYSKADISISPPPWMPSSRAELLGTTKIRDAKPILKLDNQKSNQFLHALMQGQWPTVTHHTFYDSSRYVQVKVSAVRFDRYYQDYLGCADKLLPINFDQVAKSKVLFKSGEDVLDQKDAEILERIIFYVKNDPRVHAVYLDGHSDNQGRRYDNRQMSKRRVEAVERYLVANGISSEMVTTRFHGGRYPIANNNTAAGRAQNRRVTLRLEMKEGMPIPDNLMYQSASYQGAQGRL